jgi:hypothetical protein
MCQAFLTGIPIVAVVKDIPQAFYLVSVFLVFFLCLVVLSLIFMPKIIIQYQYSRMTEPEQRRMLTLSVRKSAYYSSISRGGHGKASDEFSTRRISGLELPLESDPASSNLGSLNNSGTVQRQGSEHRRKSGNFHSAEFKHKPSPRRLNEAKARRLDASVQEFLLSGHMQLPSSSSSVNNLNGNPSSSDNHSSSGDNLHSDHGIGPRFSGEVQDNHSNDFSSGPIIPEEDSNHSNIRSHEIVFVREDGAVGGSNLTDILEFDYGKVASPEDEELAETA